MNSRILNVSHIHFYDILTEMRINNLNTEITDDITNNYAIEILDIEKVLKHIYEGEVYFKFVMDGKMIRLVNFIKEGNKIIPPIIRYINDTTWAIVDGQHRIGLCLHLDIRTIPFLIRKDQTKYTQQLK